MSINQFIVGLKELVFLVDGYAMFAKKILRQIFGLFIALFVILMYAVSAWEFIDYENILYFIIILKIITLFIIFENKINFHYCY